MIIAIFVIIATIFVVNVFLLQGTTLEEARIKIESLPEVQEYKNTLAKSGTKTQIDVEDLGSEWNVHVYEIINNEGFNHTATFGWYTVDKKTGIIIKQ